MSFMMKKTTSPYAKVIKSGIHSQGVAAKKDIPKDTEIIEYVGQRLTKKQSSKRSDEILDEHKSDSSKGAVYIFEINSRHDIDGNVSYNTARLINHSCSPNCEAVNDKGHIWISSIRDIKKGEELTYNYGYDIDSYEEHPCRCGSKNCVGYIAGKEHWPKLKRKLLKEGKTLHKNWGKKV